MHSYQSLIHTAAQSLMKVGDTPRIDAEMLAQHAFQRDLAWLIAHHDDAVPESQAEHYLSLIEQRKSGKPIAYITGHKAFWSLELTINEAVLIPRPDTETLVEAALHCLPTNAAVLDLGTGSGAIALAIAKERSDCHVVGIDKSAAAISLAKQNAANNAINNVEFCISDWYQTVVGKRFDVIVSNPPYIAKNDPTLDAQVAHFEPDTALYSEHNGLADLNIIIGEASPFLNDQAYLLVEHGHQQQEAVKHLFEQTGFTDITSHTDLNGIERVTQGKRA